MFFHFLLHRVCLWHERSPTADSFDVIYLLIISPPLYCQTAMWIKSAAVLKHALGSGFTSVVPNGFVFCTCDWSVCICLHAHMHSFAYAVCAYCLFSLFRPLCRHNPSVYEITRAHLCSGGSHLGAEEASAGNHLGSTQCSFHSAFAVRSTLWRKPFTLKGGETQTACVVCLSLCKTHSIQKSFGPRWNYFFMLSMMTEKEILSLIGCNNH